MKKVLRITAFSLCLLFVFSGCKKEEQESDLSEKTVAVEANSTEHIFVSESFKEYKEVKTFSTKEAAVVAVENGDANYLVLDEFSTQLYIENKRKIEIVKQIDFTAEYYAYFTDENLASRFNSALLDCFENGAIERIKESHKTSNGGAIELNELSGNATTLVVGISVTGEPYCDLKENGYVVGIDADVASAVANAMGCNVEFLVLGEEELFSSLSNGEVDFIISGLTYDAEKLEYFTPSLAYLSVNYNLLEKK